MTTTEPAGAVAVPAVEPLSPQEEADLRTFFEEWTSLSEAEEHMPPPSPLAFRLLSLDTHSPSISRELEEIIGSDPVLAARVLGVANSARFGSAGKPLVEIQAAIMRLGIDLTMDVCEAQLLELWMRTSAAVVDPALMHALWLEYLMTGFCAREIALMLSGDVDRHVAYAGGMLHDVGTLALCWSQPKLMSRFVAAGYAQGTPLNQAFVIAHTGLGAGLLRRWNAPRELVQIAGTHHAGLNPRALASALVVFVSDHLHEAVFEHEGIGLKAPADYPLGCFGGATEAVTAALDALGLADQLDAIILRVGKASHRLEMLATGLAK